MPLDLPAPDEALLPRSPLVLVVCQIRFEDMPAVSDARVVLKVQEALGGRTGEYPKVEKNISQVVNVPVIEGHVQAAVPQQQTGWRLSSAAGERTIYLMPDSISLETTAYPGWEDFRSRLTRLVDAVCEYIDPALEQRLGLRYVNRITEPVVSHPREWRDYITPELLGPILHKRLGPAIQASQQQLDFDVTGEMQCSVRHGFFSDAARSGAPAYLLDFDVYRQGARAFDRADILETVEQFHRLVLQLFQQSITPRMHDLLRTPND
jgi:uncharacterized protein (TIGR04255 family)